VLNVKKCGTAVIEAGAGAWVPPGFVAVCGELWRVVAKNRLAVQLSFSDPTRMADTVVLSRKLSRFSRGGRDAGRAGRGMGGGLVNASLRRRFGAGSHFFPVA
jgi:hypothetical protein